MTVVINGTTGITAPALDSDGNLEYSGTLTGGTGVINIGSGQVYKDASGNVGIGTVSPAAKLDVRGNAYFAGNATSRQTAQFANTGGEMFLGLEASSGGAVFVGSSAYASIIGSNNATSLQLGTNGTIKATLDTSGNLGLGVTPSAWSSLYKALQINTTSALWASSDAVVFSINNYNDGSFNRYITTGAASRYFQNSGAHAWEYAASGTAGATITFNRGMTLDSSGNLLVGRTNQFNQERFGFTTTTDIGAIAHRNAAAYYPWVFETSAGTVGYIFCSGSSTAYVTSSDYRLKENVAPMTGALEKVAQLKPVTYTWKADGSNGQGFIAHELQGVVPDCVTGEKDAVDADGKPQYQGVDTSFLVATLVAAIQEQQATIAAMETRLAALEA